MQDEIFIAEQNHLSETYTKLESIRTEAEENLARLNKAAGEDFAAMKDELFLGSADADQILEMQVEYEIINTMINQYNLSYDIDTERLKNALKLLQKPYFAKVVVKFPHSDEPRELYIGDAGMTDENCRHFIIDWRSPVAEVYYNQDNGATSYEANGRTIQCDLQLRRQFDIYGSTLKAYFDTSVALEDRLLIDALMKQRSDKMSAITATIQREQNQVIRHKDIPVLMVNGIAGSGKTSVLLQRIAYLFYHNRQTLNPTQVYLISPNAVFSKYIDGVLPELGETNPYLVTYRELMAQIGCADRKSDAGVTFDDMLAIERATRDYRFKNGDFCDLKVGSEVVIHAAQIGASFHKHRNIPTKRGMVELVTEDLHDLLESRIKSRSKSEAAHDELMDLSPEEKRRIFGQDVFPQSEKEFRELTETYLRDRYKGISARIESATWLRYDRLGKQLLGIETLSRAQWAYLKICLTGLTERDVRYVMIDEVQDYTQAQLTALCAYFPKAHFLLLGDENQAIKETSSTFAEIHDVFSQMCAEVVKDETGCAIDECRLLTSYRSTPEITALFSTLLNDDAHIEVSSIQRPGNAPVVKAFSTEDEYFAAIKASLDDSSDTSTDDGNTHHHHPASHILCNGELGAEGSTTFRTTALIACDDTAARNIYSRLTGAGIEAVLMDGKQPLPKQGIAVLSVKEAKGLEFDRVIIVDATSNNYPDTDLGRHRLYTAISRATQSVSIFALGTLTPLLA